jgi:hypothetical protein
LVSSNPQTFIPEMKLRTMEVTQNSPGRFSTYENPNKLYTCEASSGKSINVNYPVTFWKMRPKLAWPVEI